MDVKENRWADRGVADAKRHEGESSNKMENRTINLHSDRVVKGIPAHASSVIMLAWMCSN